MAQHTIVQIPDSARGVDIRAIGRARNRVDRQVTPAQVVFQRNFWPRMKRKAPIAATRFPFGARQCVFFTGGGMQEDRKIPADRRKPPTDHFLGRRSDDDPVAIAVHLAQQAVSHGTAHDVHLQARGGGIRGHGSSVFPVLCGMIWPSRCLSDWGTPENNAA